MGALYVTLFARVAKRPGTEVTNKGEATELATKHSQVPDTMLMMAVTQRPSAFWIQVRVSVNLI